MLSGCVPRGRQIGWLQIQRPCRPDETSRGCPWESWVTCTLPVIPSTVTITLFWTPHGLAHYLKESPFLSNSIRKRCVSLPGRFSSNLDLVSESSPSLLPSPPFPLSLSLSLPLPPSLSLSLSLIFPKKRYFSPIKLLHVSIILGTSNTLIFQNSIISRPSCSPAVWRLFRGCPGARGQRLSFTSALHMIQVVLLMTSLRNHFNCAASALGVLVPCWLLSTLLSTKGTGCENRWEGKLSPVLCFVTC